MKLNKNLTLILLSYFLSLIVIGIFVTVPTDMADHWVWSRSLQFSYLEHPAAIAVFMRFFDIISPFSSVLTLKILSALTFSATLLLSYFFAKFVYSKKAAIIHVSLLACSIYFMPFGIFLSINIIMLFFWVLGMFIFVAFIRTRKSYLLILFAIVAGLGGNSKFIYVLLCLSVVIYMLYDSKMYWAFKKPILYIAPFITLLVFSPVLYWSIQNDFMNFKFILHKGLGGGSSVVLPIATLLFQIFLYSPFIVISFWYLLLRGKFNNFKEVSETKFIKIATLTPFIFFTVSGFFGKVADPLWLDSTYISASLLVSNYLSQSEIKAKLMRYLALIFTILILAIVVIAFVYLYYRGKYDFVSVRAGDAIMWDKTGAEIEESTKQKLGFMPKYVASTDYQLAGGLSLYIPSKPLAYSLQRPQRNQWLSNETLKNEGFLLICPPEDCSSAHNKIKNNITNSEKVFLFENKTMYGKTLIRWFEVYYYPPIR